MTGRCHLPRRGSAFAAVAGVFVVVMVGGTLPTPLYVVYQQQLGFPAVVITRVFAAYPVGTLVALLFLGRASDRLGRRVMLLASVGLAAASTACFLFAAGTPELYAGRFLSGMSVGVVVGTATAHLAELDPDGDRRRSGLVAAVANMAGLSLGPLLAGALAQYAPAPTVVVFVVFLVLLAVAAGVVLAAPETVPASEGALPVRPQRLSVPRAYLGVFLSASAAVFAAFALLGLFSSLAPTFLQQTLGERNHAVAGLIVFALFAAAILAELRAARVRAHLGMIGGLGLLPAGLTLVVAALPTGLLAVFVVGTLISGAGVGLAFHSSLSLVNTIASTQRRGEVVSTFFVVAYLGVTVPIIGVGVLTSHLGTFPAIMIFAAVVTGLAIASAVLTARRAADMHKHASCTSP